MQSKGSRTRGVVEKHKSMQSEEATSTGRLIVQTNDEYSDETISPKKRRVRNKRLPVQRDEEAE